MITDIIVGLSLNWFSRVPRKYRITLFVLWNCNKNRILWEYSSTTLIFFIALHAYLHNTYGKPNRFSDAMIHSIALGSKKTLIIRHWTSHSNIAYVTIFVYLCPSPISPVCHWNITCERDTQLLFHISRTFVLYLGNKCTLQGYVLT